MVHTVSCALWFLCPCDSLEHPCSPTLPKNIQGAPCSTNPARASSMQWKERTLLLCTHAVSGNFPLRQQTSSPSPLAGIHECHGCKSTNQSFLCLQALSSMPTPGQHNSGKIIHPLQFQKPLQLAQLPSTASKGNPAGTLSHCGAHGANFP